MPVKFLKQNKRGCGTRKLGGLYMFFDMSYLCTCARLPMPLPDACPCCGEGIRFCRTVKTINPLKLFGESSWCNNPACYVCRPPATGGLFWVGKQYYTPEQFITEGQHIGISKRIPAKPTGLKAGDAVYFVHPKACKDAKGEEVPGVFFAARLTEYQKIIAEEQAKDEVLIEKLEKDGIVPVVEIVEDGQTSICESAGVGD